MTRTTYVLDGGRLIPKPPPAVHPKRSRTHEAPHKMKPFTPFLSPVDGSYVETREQHRRHNLTHGVTDVGNEPMFKNPTPSYTPLPKAKRVDDIKAAMHQHGAE